MTVVQLRPMTVAQFLTWEEGREERHELVGGRPVAMAPETLGHTDAKASAWLALSRAIRLAGLPCRSYGDGPTVPIDQEQARRPDALVRCGEPLPPGTVIVPDPMVVVEVLSPGTRETDTVDKVVEYFSLPSVQHYLVVDHERREVTHNRHGRPPAVLRDGDTARLDPPGFSVAVTQLLRATP
jgi:Uma2 family endonuclease